MVDTAIDFLLKNVKHLMKHDEDQITPLYEELRSLRTFLEDSEKKWYEHAEIPDLVTQIIDLGYEAKDIIESSLAVGGFFRVENTSGWFHPFCPYRILGDVIKEMKSFKKALMDIYDKKLYGIAIPQVDVSSHASSSRGVTPNIDDELVVGFEHEVEMIKGQLVGGSTQLEVISIVGMAGSGKTTLARKLYDDPYIVYHFYVRGWTTVSHEYRKRDLLLSILSSIPGHKEIYTMTDEKLGVELYQQLRDRRYFIVMDDIWHARAWNDLKKIFPNDCNGSRIMLTSRQKDVALHAEPHSPPHFMRFMSEDESWDLLQQKVFGKETCHPDLVEIGKQIAQKCQGLPLAIVVVAGLLAKTVKTQDWWNEVAEKVSSFLVSDPKQYLDILALSYNHLPDHLKSCFLYFGAFPEDYEIPAQKLIWLWMAEGFIHQIGERSPEDVAKEYLMDLIDRSLILVAKKGSAGGIKSCRIHDLLRDLCLRKAEEQDFLQQIYGYEQAFSFFSSPKESKQRRLSIHSRFFNYLSLGSSAPSIRSFFCYKHEQRTFTLTKLSVFCQAFKLLRVLDISSIHISFMPEPIENLIDLRYLAFQFSSGVGLDPIFRLGNLETLILRGVSGFMKPFQLPDTFWNMVKLRHVHMSGINNIRVPTNDLYPAVLDNLQTLSLVSPSSSFGGVLARTPNLKRLGFFGPLISELSEYLTFPDLDFLYHLEILKLSNSASMECSNSSESELLDHPTEVVVLDSFESDCSDDPNEAVLLETLDSYICCNLIEANLPTHPVFDDGRPSVFKWVKFPPNLKKLTLENTFLAWKEMSIIGMLPNLEVLKLRHDACIGPKWETRDGEFCRLKVLKLDDLYIAQWNTSRIHFPSLRHLELYECQKLEEIPPCLGYIPTLQSLELWWCSYSAVNSARQIQEEQKNRGNDWLKILINCSDEKSKPSA